MLNIQIDVSDFGSLDLAIEKVENIDFREPLEDAGAVLLNRMRTRFLAAVDPDGQAWPVSAASLKRTGGKTLFDTGNLFRSLQVFREKIEDDQIEIGTDVEYGKYHQRGTSFLPKRVFLGFNKDDISTAESVFIRAIEDQLKGAT